MQLTDQLTIFTRYPEPGHTKTRLISALGEEGAASLQKELTEKTIQKIDHLCYSYWASIGPFLQCLLGYGQIY